MPRSATCASPATASPSAACCSDISLCRARRTRAARSCAGWLAMSRPICTCISWSSTIPMRMLGRRSAGVRTASGMRRLIAPCAMRSSGR
ncbi:hypothetical protein BDV59DRAFT_177622, partial [Aspergillus ambiguus]|uniref:uncharacterized protein n=1 Tax=Aspergillus ambiguus TaxID=176160 RepID=UPI003CCE1408